MRYRIDPQASRFTARAFAGGPLSAMGHNPTFAVRDFHGEVEFDPGAPATGSVRLVARATSLALTDNVSDKDRREIERTTREQVLESERFPDIAYDCPSRGVTTEGTQVRLAGELTLHGVTRAQSVSARLFPLGGLLRGQGETTIRLSEYGIAPVSVAGGMLKVKDEITLTYDIVARLAPEETPAGTT